MLERHEEQKIPRQDPRGLQSPISERDEAECGLCVES